MSELNYTELRAKFMQMYLAGATEEQIRKQLKLSSSQFLGFRAFTTDAERKRRHLARRSIREKEYRMKAVASPDCAVVVKQLQLSRNELLAHIESLLRCNGVWPSMKSYERLDNKRLSQVRDRLMRNRSDRYQYSST